MNRNILMNHNLIVQERKYYEYLSSYISDIIPLIPLVFRIHIIISINLPDDIHNQIIMKQLLVLIRCEKIIIFYIFQKYPNLYLESC